MKAKTDAELLRILVGCGAGYFKGSSIREMLGNLLDMPAADYNGQSGYPGMRRKADALVELLRREQRQGTTLQEGAAVKSMTEVWEAFKYLIAEKQEHFYAVLLDNKHRIIKTVLVSLGILNQALVHPREVFAPAIEARAASIIVVHNHPSGDSAPSAEDIGITKRLRETGDIIGIKLVDHVIIGKKAFSFVDEGLIT